MKASILRKIDLLRDLVTDDRWDEVVGSALDYLLSYEQAKLGGELDITRQHLDGFEKKYGMNGREFLRKYESGSLEDKKEFLEWFVLLSLEVSLEKKLQRVDAVAGDSAVKNA